MDYGSWLKFANFLGNSLAICKSGGRNVRKNVPARGLN